MVWPNWKVSSFAGKMAAIAKSSFIKDTDSIGLLPSLSFLLLPFLMIVFCYGNEFGQMR